MLRKYWWALLLFLLLLWLLWRRRGAEPRSAHFSHQEFYSRGRPVPKQYWSNLKALMRDLEVLRKALGNRPITISSGYRAPDHNKAIGGATRSQHLYANAGDIKVSGVPPHVVQAKIKELMLAGRIRLGGIGRASTYTHIDGRGRKTAWKYIHGGGTRAVPF